MTGHDFAEAYLLPLAATDLMRDHLHEQTEVICVGRSASLKTELVGQESRGDDDFRLLVRDAHGSERVDEADIVIDASGTFGNHNHLGQGGTPAIGETAAPDRITYELPDILGVDRERYAGRHVLVVGGGYSAATAIVTLAELARQTHGTNVTWVTRPGPNRDGPISRIPGDRLSQRDELAQSANSLADDATSAIHYRPNRWIRSITPDAATGQLITQLTDGDQQTETLAVNQIIANVGYRPDHRVSDELQLHRCYASDGPMRLAAAMLSAAPTDAPVDCLEQTSAGPESLLTPEPDFYVLGAKSSWPRFAIPHCRRPRTSTGLVHDHRRSPRPRPVSHNRRRGRHNVSVASTVPQLALSHLDDLWFQVSGTLCNLTCHHCFISCGPKNDSFGYLSLTEVRRYLDESVAKGVKEYYFTGGEPFLNREMVPILVETLHYGPATVLTNATVLCDEWLIELAEAERRSTFSLEFRVSLDGFSPETNDPIRGQGTFERALRGIEQLVAHGFLPIITAVRTWPIEQDRQYTAAFVEMLKSRGYTRPRLKLLPTLQIGAEAQRTEGYAAHDRLTTEMLDDFDRSTLVCEHSRVVTDRGVYVCPILIDSPGARLGTTLDEANVSFGLSHGACCTCYRFGAICSNPSSQA